MAISEKPPKLKSEILINALNTLKPQRSVPSSEDPEGKHDCVLQPEVTRLPEDPQVPALDKNGLPLGDGDGGLVFIHPPIQKKHASQSGA